ncbi:MAG TPA: FkbM family methyltransferase [Bryobacteraceae bacterium]|nr:FkbM family methyltransferase [Bryobacteraceae bacterium]
MRKKLLLVLACILITLIIGIFSRTTTGQLLAVTIRGNTQCPFAETMRSMDSAKAILASEKRIKQASRMLREEGTLQQWDTPRGRFWMPRNSAGMEPLVLAEQENEIYGSGPRAVQSGDVVLDCGADIGTFTRTALQHGAGTVVSIEPDPEKEPCLRRNFEKEIAAGRVIVVPKGVWNEEGTLKLYGDSVVERRGTSPGVDVPLTTIDKLVADLKLPRVDFIKMDIEGAEKQALAGARNTLVKFRPRLSIATEHLFDDAVAIPRTVRGMLPGYQLRCGPCEWADGHFRPQTIYMF